MFSLTAEYALRAVVALAQDPLPQTTQQIAARARVPSGYLSKVLQALARAGLVHSARGPHGGFALARSTSDLTAYDVINAVDPVQRIQACPLHLPAHRNRLCSLHRRLDSLMADAERTLRSSTLADFLDCDAKDRPLCATASGKPHDTPG